MTEERPIVLVSALITDNMNRALVTKHGTGRWHLPDGDVRHLESSRDALFRSVLEDLGVKINIDGRPFYMNETLNHERGSHMITLFYRASIMPNQTFLLRTGFRMSYIDRRSLGTHRVYASTKSALFQAMAGCYDWWPKR